MIRLTISLIVAAFLWSIAAPQAQAQALCGDRAELLERLEQEFSETPQALGLSEDGALIEVMVSPSGGWTILVTYPKRPSCVVATGQGWESLLVLVPTGQPA
jgi:hypothetical protein